MIHRFCHNWNLLFREDEANTTVEYALLLALIAAFCISAVLNTGDVQKSLWFDTAAAVETINP